MQRILIGLAIAGLASLAPLHAQQQASEVYEWRDASGTVHYSQTPPPKGAYQARRITTSGSAAPAAGAAAATPAATTAAAPASDRGASAECVRARGNVAALQSKAPVQQDTDGDGKPDTVLDDAQRASQLNLAQAAVQAYCTP